MSFQAIVVGTDGSETAKKAVEQAADLAKQGGGELHIVMSAQAVSEPSVPTTIEENTRAS